MKKILLLAVAAIMAAGTIQAKTADEVRIYLNPGHGSWGPNDRPMATIPYPNLPETGRPDTNGFYESNTNLWKSIQTRAQLIKMGVNPENITMSRWKNGPYPYVQGADDAEMYNRPLSEICEEVEVGNYDMFLSHHSNASTDGTSTNYPLILYRGKDGAGGDYAPGSRDMASTCWPLFYTNEIDPMNYYGPNSPNIRGDIDFYGSSSTRVDPNTGQSYTGYLGVLKHCAPGFLIEGYFHTYQPARHRALNIDYCHQEGMRIARGIGEYFGLTPDTKGYIMGTVKDVHNHLVHNLYKYNAGTMDQWAPINGAVVILYKNGQEVARYTTDQNYNGVFVFENLEPGNYTLGVEAESFKPLGEYMANAVDNQWQELINKAAGELVVEANKTTYAVPLLEATDYEVPTDMYPNYPEPDLPGYIVAPDELYLEHDGGTEYAFEGDIKRMLVRGDSTVVLTNAEDGTPHVYLINNVDKVIIKELSINGVAPAEPENAGFYSRLNDINFTADGQLVGCNMLQTQFSNDQVNEGFQRGTLRLYKWADFDSDPIEWITTQSSANFYYYRAGQSFTIDGPANECLITFLGTNDGATSAGGMRFLKLAISNDEITSTVYTEKTIAATSNFTKKKVGEYPQVILSPRNDDQVFVDGEHTLPMEVAPAMSNGVDSEVLARFDGEEADTLAHGISFFKYAQHQYMVTPYMNETAVAGIKLYDITAGLDQAALVSTTNTDLEPLACQFMSTGAAVKGQDIILYLMQDNKITKWMADADAQPTVPGIYAYGLNATPDGNNYIFTFNSNDDAETAYITLRDAEGNEVAVIDVPDVVAGENSIAFNVANLDVESGEELSWEVTLEGKEIKTIKRINPLGNTYGGQLFVVVDNSPLSPRMGTIYAGNRVANNDPGNGVYLYDANGVRVSDQVYNGNRVWRSNYRMGIDAQGKLYVPDWGDPTSGVFIADPTDLEGTWTEFFIGERNSDGLISNNGVNVGSSTPGVAIGGTGADTKLYVYLEDFGNGVGVYNIGQPDGSIVDTWSTAPNQYFDIGAWQLNTNGNVMADAGGRGVWVAQYRSAGNNTSGVPSLMFVDNDGNVTFNSGRSPYIDMLNGSDRAGFAVNDASDLLVIQDGSGTLQFFDLTWDGSTPDITPKYSFVADARNSAGSIFQMAFDYAGNLVCAGGNIGVYSLPTTRNVHTTPGCGTIGIDHGPTAVNETQVAKTVVSERYYDIRGIEYSHPIDGVNIIVRTYSDGTTQSVKVIK